MYDLHEDIESDMHRFHQVWIDIEADEYGGLSSRRLFSLAERLVAYEGAVAARVWQIQEQAKKHNPSRDAIAQGAKVVDDPAQAGLEVERV